MNIPADTIATYFDADVNTLDDAAFKAIVVEVRRRRSVFASEEATKALEPKRQKPTVALKSTAGAVASNVPANEVDLEDLL